MATAQHSSVDQIGDTAGVVWHHLDQNGSSTISQLVKDIDAPRDVVMQSLGWLAREDKISIDEDKAKKVVSLRS